MIENRVGIQSGARTLNCFSYLLFGILFTLLSYMMVFVCVCCRVGCHLGQEKRKGQERRARGTTRELGGARMDKAKIAGWLMPMAGFSPQQDLGYVCRLMY